MVILICFPFCGLKSYSKCWLGNGGLRYFCSPKVNQYYVSWTFDFFIWIQFNLSLVLTCVCVTWVICDCHDNPLGLPKLPKTRWVPGHTVGCPTLCPFRINRRTQLGLNWKSTRQRYWSSQTQINIDVTRNHSSLAQKHEVYWWEGAKARALGIRIPSSTMFMIVVSGRNPTEHMAGRMEECKIHKNSANMSLETWVGRNGCALWGKK